MENHGVAEVLEAWHVDSLHLIVNDLHVLREVIVGQGLVVSVVLVWPFVDGRDLCFAPVPLLVDLVIWEVVRLLVIICFDVIVLNGAWFFKLYVCTEPTLSSNYLLKEKKYMYLSVNAENLNKENEKILFIMYIIKSDNIDLFSQGSKFHMPFISMNR